MSSPDRKLLAREIAEELKPLFIAMSGNVISMEEVMHLLRCPSLDAVRKLCERKKIPCHKFNQRYYFFDSEIKAFLMERT